MPSREQPRPQAVYWHHALPPLEAEPASQHTIEATSGRVPGNLERHGDLWDGCYRDLMAAAERRLAQEVERLGGQCAHVHEESVAPRRDEMTGESWLLGRFTYTLYRIPSTSRSP